MNKIIIHEYDLNGRYWDRTKVECDNSLLWRWYECAL